MIGATMDMDRRRVFNLVGGAVFGATLSSRSEAAETESDSMCWVELNLRKLRGKAMPTEFRVVIAAGAHLKFSLPVREPWFDRNGIYGTHNVRFPIAQNERIMLNFALVGVPMGRHDESHFAAARDYSSQKVHVDRADELPLQDVFDLAEVSENGVRSSANRHLEYDVLKL